MTGGTNIEKLQEKLLEVLREREEVLFAYLFGSVARGTAGKSSDIDVAVYLDENNLPSIGNYGYESELIVYLQTMLHRDVDVVVLNKASIFLRFQVINEGKLFLCRSEEKRIAFHTKAQREYLDFKPFMKVQKYYLRKRIAEGRFGGGQVGES